MNKEGLKNRELGGIEDIIVFLSEITGLPVTSRSVFAELLELEGGTRSEAPFSLNLVLGTGDNKYEINVRIIFTDKWTEGEWLPTTSWDVSYDGKEIYRMGGMVCCSHSFGKNELGDKVQIMSYLFKEARFIFGGIDTEAAFMDYENYTLKSLKNEDDYFRNIYLVLMTHMKWRGLSLPPILARRPDIREAMSAGKIEVLERIIGGISLFDMPGYDQRCQTHMLREIEVIREQARWEKNRRNPMVPLIESFPNIDITIIEKGKSVFPPVNILVVENNLNNFGLFTDRIVVALDKDGRYAGSVLIKEFNLPSCMTFCETGKIDLVIFDWTSPSYEEALMVRGSRNPFFDMFHGNSQGVVTFGEDGHEQITIPNGRVFDNDALREEAKRIDIRSRWMNMIADACGNAGVAVPAYFIVRGEFELSQINAIICQKLGRPISG